MRRERNLTNHIIVSTELDRAKGRYSALNLGSRRATSNVGGSQDNSELCTLMSGTSRVEA